MAKKFAPMNNVKRESTGEFYRAKVGPKIGQVGEAVTVHGWGGVSLQFGDGEVITYADSDVEEQETMNQATLNDAGSIIVRPGTGRRASPGIWEVARTGCGRFDLILACYSNWTREDCEHYAEYARERDAWLASGGQGLPPMFQRPEVE